ncbi:hypothetical protein [Mesorhizobium sp. Pch-S]|uniref:hypothetical protein n=1 Tax=Mesorhizobium sp. Pch-S TaxID=2082387 RepID=UPI001FE030D6|nr:hypothetical protein [Mesorhizobium sp. Pch-S]
MRQRVEADCDGALPAQCQRMSRQSDWPEHRFAFGEGQKTMLGGDFHDADRGTQDQRHEHHVPQCSSCVLVQGQHHQAGGAGHQIGVDHKTRRTGAAGGEKVRHQNEDQHRIAEQCLEDADLVATQQEGPAEKDNRAQEEDGVGAEMELLIEGAAVFRVVDDHIHQLLRHGETDQQGGGRAQEKQKRQRVLAAHPAGQLFRSGSQAAHSLFQFTRWSGTRSAGSPDGRDMPVIKLCPNMENKMLTMFL